MKWNTTVKPVEKAQLCTALARLSVVAAASVLLTATAHWSSREGSSKKQLGSYPLQQAESNSRHYGGAKLYVGVLSHAENFDRRMAIRQTWGSDASLERVVFVLANPGYNGTLWRVLREEALKFRDLVIAGHVMEGYYNITHQTLEVFRSAYAYSGNTTHVMKCDDDSYVRVNRLLEFLAQHAYNSTILGRTTQYYPIREKSSPFYVSYDEWPVDKINMKYAQGTGYILSKDLADEVATTAAYMCSQGWLFKFEDAAVGSWLYCLTAKFGLRVDMIHTRHINYLGCKETDIISHHIDAKNMSCMFAADGSCC